MKPKPFKSLVIQGLSLCSCPCPGGTEATQMFLERLCTKAQQAVLLFPLHSLAQSKQPHLEHCILTGTEDSSDSLASFCKTERHSLAAGTGESL